jgi:hypothetical protein
MARGREGEDVYAQFLRQIEQADAEVERECVQIIRAAGLKGQWLAAAWMLAHKWKADWGDKQADKMYEVGELEKLTEAELVAKIQEELKRVG